MSEKLGAMTFGRTQSARFLEGMGMEERTDSEETARAIDAEVRAIMDGQHRRATEILTREREVLERMTLRLIEVETLDRAELESIVSRPAVAGAPTP
jgi:cell division protease FtsH